MDHRPPPPRLNSRQYRSRLLFAGLCTLICGLLLAISEYRWERKGWDERLSSLAQDRARILCRWLDANAHVAAALASLQDKRGRAVLPAAAPAPLSSAKIGRIADVDILYSAKGPNGWEAGFRAPIAAGGSVTVWAAPERTLFPDLLPEPVPTRTAEFMLVRKEGESALFLTPLRHKTSFAARHILAGEAGFRSYTDYRNERVWAALLPLPEIGFWMVAKIDRSEALSDFWKNSLTHFLLLTALWLAYALFLTRQKQRTQLSELAEELSAERSRLFADAVGAASSHLPGAIYTYRLVGDSLRMEAIIGGLPGLLGYDAESFLSGRLGMLDLVRTEDHFKIRSALATAAATGDSYKMEYQVLAKDGRLDWVEDRGIASPDGADILCHGFLIRVTERKEAESASLESQERFRLLVEGSPEAIFVQSGGLIAYCNPAMVSLLGVSGPEQLFSKPHMDMIAPEYRAVVDQRIRRQRETGTAAPLREMEFLRRNGSRVWVETTAVPIRFLGRDSHLVFVRDITQRHAAQAALRQSQDRLLLAAQAAGFGTYSYDFTTAQASYSDEFLAMYGLAPGAALELDQDLVPKALQPQDRLAFLAGMKAANEPGGSGILDIQYRITRADGQQRWLRVRGRTTFSDSSASARPLHANGIIQDITGRRLEEECQRLAESSYTSLFENMLNGFAYCRMIHEDGQPSDFVYLSVNSAFVTLTGLKDVKGKRVSEVIPGFRDSDPEILERYGRVARTGQAERFEIYLNALKMWFEVSVYCPLPEHFVAVFDVITARKQGEQALQEMAREWQETFDASSDAIVLLDAQGQILRSNKKAGRLAAAEPAQLKSQECWRVFHGQGGTPPASCPRLRAQLSRKRETQEFAQNGEIYEVTFDPRLSPAGEFLGGIHITRDVTRRSRMERRISRLNDYFLSQSTDASENLAQLTVLLGELLGAGCVLYNRIEGDIVQVSGRWQAPEDLPERMPASGQVCDAVFQRASHEAVHIKDLRATPYAQSLASLLARDLGVYLGQCVFAAGKPIGVLCAFCPDGYAPDEADRRLIGILASTVGMEEHRRGLETQFLQSQKMEAVGRLAGGVAHDFNNMLTAIKGYCEFLTASLAVEDVRRDDVLEIMKAADRACALTRQLLAFSRRQVLAPTVLCLNDVVGGMRPMLRRLIPEDVHLEFRLAADLALTRVDAGQMEQVVMNLVVNARDAMPQGGTITVETKAHRLGHSRPQTLAGLPDGRYVLLEVRDTGTGISPDVHLHLFEPFFTTKEKGKGTGLGLSTVYGIIKQSGGEITVDSEPGHGAAFNIYLPVCTEPAAPGAAPEAAGPQAGGHETVLLVEDEAAVRSLAERSLVKYGYRVLAFENAGKALGWLRQNSLPIEIMVTDIIMPGMNGKELADEVRRIRPATKILFISGYTDDTLTVQGILVPGVSLLQKPFTPESLACRVREKIDEETQPCPQE